jgi:hypothetical protein
MILMGGKILFIIQSGHSDPNKALWGMRMALNTFMHPYGEKIIEDVKVLLFADGVSIVDKKMPGYDKYRERLLHLEQASVEVVACVTIATQLGLLEEFKEARIPLVHASEYVAERVSEGYTAMNF